MSIPRQGADLNDGVYRTPLWFLKEVNTRWNIGFDLAADADNSVVDRLWKAPIPRKSYFDVKDDALILDWGCQWKPNGELRLGFDGEQIDFAWLNPPFSKMRPWVKKTAESNCPVVMLFPNSPGAGWWNDFVDGKCLVLDLIGRLRFMGEVNVYPKDLALAVYGSGVVGRGKWDLRGLSGYTVDAMESRVGKNAVRDENMKILTRK